MTIFQPSRPAGETAEIAGSAFLERLGRRVRAEWVEYYLETSVTKPSHLAGWEEITDWDREADRRIGRGVVDEWETMLEEGKRPAQVEWLRPKAKPVVPPWHCPMCGNMVCDGDGHPSECGRGEG